MCQKLVDIFNLNSTRINLSFYFIACTKLGQHHRPVWVHTCTYKTLTFDTPLFLVFSQRPDSLSISSSRYLSLFFCMYEDWVTGITRTSSLERAAVCVCVGWCVWVCGVCGCVVWVCGVVWVWGRQLSLQLAIQKKHLNDNPTQCTQSLGYVYYCTKCNMCIQFTWFSECIRKRSFNQSSYLSNKRICYFGPIPMVQGRKMKNYGPNKKLDIWNVFL